MKDIITCFSLMLCVPCSFILLQEVGKLRREVKELKKKLEDLE